MSTAARRRGTSRSSGTPADTLPAPRPRPRRRPSGSRAPCGRAPDCAGASAARTRARSPASTCASERGIVQRGRRRQGKATAMRVLLSRFMAIGCRGARPRSRPRGIGCRRPMRVASRPSNRARRTARTTRRRSGAPSRQPSDGETEVEIAQHAAEGDRAEIDAVAEIRRARFERVEPRGHFFELTRRSIPSSAALRGARMFRSASARPHP